jgi:hypothetical protein
VRNDLSPFLGSKLMILNLGHVAHGNRGFEPSSIYIFMHTHHIAKCLSFVFVKIYNFFIIEEDFSSRNKLKCIPMNFPNFMTIH